MGPVLVRAPNVETERLLLRAHRQEDFPDTAALWANEEVTRYIGGRPFSREESWGRLLRHAGHWALLGLGSWVVCEKATGRFLGEVGLVELRRDVVPSFEGAREIGWALCPEAQGKGFAREAVEAVLSWTAAHLGPSRTVCMIDVANEPSLRLAQRCGYRRFAETTYHGAPVSLWERFVGGAP